MAMVGWVYLVMAIIGCVGVVSQGYGWLGGCSWSWLWLVWWVKLVMAMVGWVGVVSHGYGLLGVVSHEYGWL